MSSHALLPRIFLNNNLVHFRDALLKGYGQVLICLNPLTGILFFFIIFSVSQTIFLLSFLGVFLATLTAVLIKAKPSHIETGVYGFNGVVLGIAWPWFLNIHFVSILLFIFFVCLSSVIIKCLIGYSSRQRSNLPFLSVPTLIIIWFISLLFPIFPILKDYVGSDPSNVKYLYAFQTNFGNLSSDFSLAQFWKTFYYHILITIFILFSIGIHSRLSLFMAFSSFFITILTVFILGGPQEFQNIDFYLYNAIPAGIALGGVFLVLTRSVFLLTCLGVILINLIVFWGIREFPLPIFVLPFNLITIFFIWLVKSGLLKREQEFTATPMDLVSSPEIGLQWLKGEIYAQNYWRAFEKFSFRIFRKHF